MFQAVAGSVLYLRNLLYKPRKVFIICLSLLLLALVFDGTFFRLWSLTREEHRLADQIVQLKADNLELHHSIERVKSPRYMERLAHDRFDWVAPDELIFVFDDGD